MIAVRRVLIILAVIITCGWVAWPVSFSNAATVHHWETCRPRAIFYPGGNDPQGYRLDDDIFAGYTGRYCIAGTSDYGFRILDNVPGDSKVVIAYPKVFIGQDYDSTDPQAGLPLKVTQLGKLTLHVGSWGQSPGLWQSDSDDWFWPASNTSGHGAWELVIITRLSGGRKHDTFPCTVRLSGRCWYYSPWVTHQTYLMGNREVTGSWPLIFFEASRPDLHKVRLPLGLFTAWAIKTGWLPRTAWLGQIGYGTEVWTGGRGLHLSMQVNGLPHIPTIKAPPGGKS